MSLKNRFLIVMGLLLAMLCGCTQCVDEKAAQILIIGDTRPKNIEIPGDPNYLAIIGSPEFDCRVQAWHDEIRTEFKTEKILAVHIHGGYDLNDWMFVPSSSAKRVAVDKQVKEWKKLFDGYTIILLTCNPAKVNLYTPGVYYAPGDVWQSPDSSVQTPRKLTHKEWAENITWDLVGWTGGYNRETEKGLLFVGSIAEFYTEGKPYVRTATTRPTTGPTTKPTTKPTASGVQGKSP